jgi:hypothetical protein
MNTFVKACLLTLITLLTACQAKMPREEFNYDLLVYRARPAGIAA